MSLEISHAAGVQTKWLLDITDNVAEAETVLVESLVDVELLIVEAVADRRERLVSAVHTLNGRDYLIDDGARIQFRWRPLVFDWRCLQCGADTDALDEYYMVDDEVWEQVTDSSDGHLCVGCLESRLGRRLSAADFTDSPVNSSDELARSDRLRDRIAGRG